MVTKIRSLKGINAIADKQKKVKENADASAKAASSLFGSKGFEKYREEAQHDLSTMIKVLLRFTEADPVKYAFRVRSLIEQMNSSLSLLYKVHADAKADMEFEICIKTKMVK